MTVSISAEKQQKLQLADHRIIESKSPSIREVAQIISMIISCFLRVEYGLRLILVVATHAHVTEL